MKRFMYCGYPQGTLELKSDAPVVTASLVYHKDMAILYFEAPQELRPEEVVDGSLSAFPDGNQWWKMAEIFHYFPCDDDELWQRKVENKTSVIRVNYLHQDKIASYIYHHYDHQESNAVGVDRYGSIFIYQNMIIMYMESPTEKVQWSDIYRKPYKPGREDWAELMDQHFKPWDDGVKGWRLCDKQPL